MRGPHRVRRHGRNDHEVRQHHAEDEHAPEGQCRGFRRRRRGGPVVVPAGVLDEPGGRVQEPDVRVRDETAVPAGRPQSHPARLDERPRRNVPGVCHYCRCCYNYRRYRYTR